MEAETPSQRAARKHGTVGFEVLPDDQRTQLVEAAARGEVTANEGSVGHVEVFRMAGRKNLHHRKTSTPTQLPTRRPRSRPDYTVNCHEPVYLRLNARNCRSDQTWAVSADQEPDPTVSARDRVPAGSALQRRSSTRFAPVECRANVRAIDIGAD